MRKYLLLLFACLLMPFIASALDAPTHLYLIGNIQGHDWKPADGVEFTKNGNVFTMKSVTLTKSEGTAYFRLTSVASDDWDSSNGVNANCYGPASDNTPISNGQGILADYKTTNNWTVANGTYDIEVNFSTLTIKLTAPGSGNEQGSGEQGGEQGGNEQGGQTDPYAGYPDLYFLCAAGNWTASDAYKFTRAANTNNYSIHFDAIDTQFKISTSNWSYNLGVSGGKTINTAGTHTFNVNTGTGERDNVTLTNLKNVDITFTLHSANASSVSITITCETESTGGNEQGGNEQEEANCYVYFDNSSTNWSNVYVWAWVDDDTPSTTALKWPGDRISQKNGKYYWELPAGKLTPNFIIFHDNTGDAHKTADFPFVNKATYDFNGVIGGGSQGGSQGGGQIAQWRSDVEPTGTLPILYINVYEMEADGVTPKVDGDGNNIYNDYVINYDLLDKTYRSGKYWLDPKGAEGIEALGSADEPLDIEVKGRGNYTLYGFAKKPLKLKLGKKQNLMGLSPAKSKHYALLAHADDNMGYLRNFVGFNLGDRIGLPWTPDQQPVEVVINGDYRGVYFLTESVRVGDGRVDITELKDEATDPLLVSGGYLLEMDNYDEPDDTQIDIDKEVGGNWLLLSFESPEIYSQEQRDFVRNQFTTMNDLVNARDANLWKYLDLDDAARYYLVMEILSHYEAFHGSTYIYRDRGNGERWHFSPIWDCGHAFDADPYKFFYDRSSAPYGATHYGNTWVKKLRQMEDFNNKVYDTWKWFMTKHYDGLMNDIDAYVNKIAAAADRDHQRWNGKYPMGGPNKTVYNPQGNPYQTAPVEDNSDIQGRKNYVKGRINSKLDFLKGQFGNYTVGGPYAEPQRDSETRPYAPLPDNMIADEDVCFYLYDVDNAWGLSADNAPSIYLYNNNGDNRWNTVKMEYDPYLTISANGVNYTGVFKYQVTTKDLYAGHVIFYLDDSHRYPADKQAGMEYGHSVTMFLTNGTELLPAKVNYGYSGKLPVINVTTTDPAAEITYGTPVAMSYYADPFETGVKPGKTTKNAQLTGTIKLRGSDWAQVEKKSYKLDLDKKDSICGLENNKNFALMAYSEPAGGNTMLQNYLGHEISKTIGLNFTSDMTPVELVINGSYKGLYMLVETINADRLGLSEYGKKKYNAENEWLVEVTNTPAEGTSRFSWADGAHHVVPENPDFAAVAEADLATIQGHLDNHFGNILAAVSNAATNQESDDWTAVIDRDQAAKYYVVQELMDDSRAFTKNFYMHHAIGSLWNFGPVWDFRGSFNHSGENSDLKDGLLHGDDVDASALIADLYKNARFREYVFEVFNNYTSEVAGYSRRSVPAREAYLPETGNLSTALNNLDAFAAAIAPAVAAEAANAPTANSFPAEANLGDLTDALAAEVDNNVEYLAGHRSEGGAGWNEQDVTGIGSIINDGDNNAAPVEYFDLTGRRVANPSPGTFLILRQGSRVTKLTL